MSAPHHRWLLQQLPKWQEEGLITAEAAAILRQRSENAAEDHSSNRAQMVMGALGALLVGIGLIAVIGYNWDDFSRPVRLLFAFVPLLAAQCYTGWILRKGDEGAPWHRETAGLLQTLMAGAAIALVSQIYNMGGDWTQFVLAWCLVSLPLAWVLGAHTVAVFYLMGAAVWVLGKADLWDVVFEQSRFNSSPWIYLALLAGLIPYALGLGQKTKGWPNTVRWLGYLSLQAGLGAVAWHAVKQVHQDFGSDFGASTWLRMITTALLMLIPLTAHGRSEPAGRKPQVLLGGLELLFIGMILTFPDAMDRLCSGARLAMLAPWCWFLLTVLAAFTAVAVLHRRWAVLSVAVIAVLPLIGGALGEGSGHVMAWMMTGYLSLAALALIVLEFTGRQGAPRMGAALLSLLIIMRFASSEFALLGKGLLFIVVGVCFLVFNIYVGRWRKARRAAALSS